MKNFLPFFKKALALTSTALFFLAIASAQTVDIITSSAGSSANYAFATQPYAASECIYLDAEVGASNFITAGSAINQIAFNTTTLGSPTTFTNVTIWMKEVPAATTSFATGTYTTAGYTQVFSGSVTVPAVGFTPILLTTTFQRTAGNNLQVLVERADGIAHGGFIYRASNGNSASTSVVSARRYNSTAALSASTVLTQSVIRAQIRLQHVYANDAAVQEVYTMGKLPIPAGTPHTIKANISNSSATTLTNIPVTLNITGANTFTNTQTIASLAAGASIDVTFTAFTPAATGTNIVSVSIPNDDFNGNNLKTVTQVVNNNTFSYSYSSASAGAVGFNGSTGDLAARFKTSIATAISQVSLNFVTGGQPYQLAIWDATGAGGTPGSLLYTSVTLTSVAGVYVLPVLPAVPVAAGDFFVGIKQTGTVNVSLAYQNEDPIRVSTFYLTQPTGGTTWSDLSPVNKFKFMIDPKLQLPVDANLSGIVTPSATCNGNIVNYGAVLTNVGSSAIAPGTASVTLKITGANTATATLTNTTSIVSGGSETISFTGIDISNAGTNSDAVYVTLSGDPEQENDTLRTTNVSAAPVYITSFPSIENAEAGLPLLPFFKIVTGSNQLWRVQSGNYANADQTAPLVAHGGSRFFLFDSYSGGNSAGSISRLASNCISLPGNSGSNCSYKLRFWMSHDNTATRPALDSMYVSVSTNNGVSWTRLLPGFQRLAAGYTTPGWEKLEKDLSAYAGQIIQIGFEGVSKYGNAIGLDDITIASIPAQELILSPASNNAVTLTKQCDDQGWTYYSNPANATAGLFAINWDPSNAGANVAAKAATTLTLQLDAAVYASEDIPAKKATYTMKRYWNLNTGASTLTAPVNIRFFYDPTEKTATDAAASTFATANTGTLKTPGWFKTSGSNFMGDANHVTPDAVVNAIPLTNVNTGGATINGLLYAQFDGVSSLSGGGYASGVGPGALLPVTLLGFEAKRAQKINQLNWSTSQQLNTGKFVVERSADGIGFSAIGEVPATGNTATIQQYNFTDNNPGSGINYYRLRIVDIDNSSKYSAVRSVRNAGSADIAIYPNPAKALITVKINSDIADKAAVAISDMSGKIISTQQLVITKGINLLPVNVDQFAAGSYFIKITLANDVIIKKFSKQ